VRSGDAAVAPELFDLAADPLESKDVASAHPELVAELRAKLASWETMR
jgi:hypothetical protein